MKFLTTLSALLFLLIGSSCYRQNIMFQTEDFEMDTQIAASMKKAEAEYLLRPDDIIDIKVETNKGEALIDPNYQLRSEFGMNNMNNQENNSEMYSVHIGRSQNLGIVIYHLIWLLAICV